MAAPKIKMMACSNVYIRQMHFAGKNDVEAGHSHTYDHATILSNGSIKYEILDKFDGDTVSEKIFTAPDMIYVEKNKFHRITALQDNTICCCTHALRSIDGDLIPPDSFIEAKDLVKNASILAVAEQKIGKQLGNLIHVSNTVSPKN